MIDKISYKAHRLAWFYVHGEWPEADVDHINGVRHDNRIANLRPATRSQNVLNSRRRSDGTARYRGVCFHKSTGQWIVSFGGRYVGIFRTEEQGHEAYLAEVSKAAERFPLPLHPDAHLIKNGAAP